MFIRSYYLLVSTVLLLGLSACVFAETKPARLSADYLPGERYMDIKLLGTLSLPPQEVNGLPMNELSALAWDEDESILYALSDHGILFYLHPVIQAGQLKDVKIQAAFRLKNKSGGKLKGKKNDSEGLVLINSTNGKKGDTELLVSFETKPRIKRFTNQGEVLGSIVLPVPLKSVKRYSGANHGLEAVTIHPEYGVITTAEQPLKRDPQNKVTLYSMSGERWQFARFPAAKSAVVAMETLGDGSILLLERAFSSMLAPIVIILRQVWINDQCQAKTGQACKTKILAILDSTMGWNVDNFEGLTQYQPHRFFMVSDNNKFWLQRTLLSYFEVMNE